MFLAGSNFLLLDLWLRLCAKASILYVVQIGGCFCEHSVAACFVSMAPWGAVVQHPELEPACLEPRYQYFNLSKYHASYCLRKQHIDLPPPHLDLPVLMYTYKLMSFGFLFKKQATGSPILSDRAS